MTTGIGQQRCLVITGPTACGKTELALALAEEFPLEIVSMDSAMVYRGMDIGTAKPPQAVRERVPHHLVDIRDPEESYSAGRFAADAARLIGAINARDRIALVVGGTMLYLKALRDGIAALPEGDPAVRADIDARGERVGWPALHAELAALDPPAAARIEPGDRQRIQRALEVHALTGQRLSDLQATGTTPGIDVAAVALVPGDRERLGLDIETRFRTMVAAGFVDEVRRLQARPGLGPDSPAMRSVGYRQIWTYLTGEADWATTEERAIIATRQLAKRQLTWLRRDERSEQLAAGDPGSLGVLQRRLARMVDNA